MMRLKKISLILLFIISFIIFTGCSKATETVSGAGGSSTVKGTIVDDDFNEKGSGKLTCTTEAYAGEGIDVALSYNVTYKRGNIIELRSVAKITSNDQASLDEYEIAYQNISDNYKGLKYYDTSLVRDSNTVTYDTIINYDKIDIDKILEIEGEEENIIENGKAKLSLWLDLAERVGTTCEEV